MSRSPALAADAPALIGRALRLCTMLRNWPDRVLDRLAGVAQLQRYERRTQVLANDRQRREVLVVVSGCLEVSGVNAQGVKFVLSMHGPGEILGLVRLLEGVEMMYDYHAHEDTVRLDQIRMHRLILRQGDIPQECPQYVFPVEGAAGSLNSRCSGGNWRSPM